MSYILDALKKSEQERGHGNIPGVQTVHTSSLSYKNSKTVWPYVLIAAVVLNLAAIIFFFVYQDRNFTDDNHRDASHSNGINSAASNTASVPQQTVPASTAVSGNRATPATDTAATIKATVAPGPGVREVNIAATADSAQPEPTTFNDTPASTARPAPSRWQAPIQDEEAIEFHELPESIKQQLPAIIVSAHVYSSNPQQRSIVINNNFLEEGEYVMDGLVLEEITADGAILLFQGERFHYGVVSGWQ